MVCVDITQRPVSTQSLDQRRLDTGKETLKGFFQVQNHKEYQNVVITSFVQPEKINIFLFHAQGCGTKIEPVMPI